MKKNKLLSIVYLIALLGSIAFIVLTFARYPRVTLTIEELYGENHQNLKDLAVTDDGLYSLSWDPWIEYHLEEAIPVKVVEFHMDGLPDKNLNGELFDLATWEKETYRVHNGRTLAFVQNENPLIADFRFDLLTSEKITFKLHKITINSTYGLLSYCFIPLAVIWITLILITQVAPIIFKQIRTSKFGRRLLLCIHFLAPCFILATYFYMKSMPDITDSLVKWTTYALITEIFLLTANWRKYKNNTGFIGIEIIAYSLLHFCLIEILSGIACNTNSIWITSWNILLLMGIWSLFYLIFRNLRISLIGLNIFTVLLGVVNHYFYIFRNNPFELSDIVMADTAMAVISAYTFDINSNMAFFLFCELGILCYLIFYQRKTERKQLFQISFIICAFTLMIAYFYTPSVNYWDKVSCVKEQGYLGSFLQYAKRELNVPKPLDYSSKEIAELLSQYEKDDSTNELPNVIVIMNEAFSDFPVTYDFETNVDGMPFIHGLTENTVKGNMYVSVVGGTTVNTEYEVLTGNSMALLNSGSVPYVQFVKREQQSLAHKLRSLGYQTVAFHPCPAENYGRNKIYPLLGFDQFISIESGLKYDSKVHGYISDEANNLTIIDLYENREPDKPFFIFNVSMQNHGGYSRTVTADECEVIPVNEDYHYPQLMEYLSLIKKTDEAFEMLIEYFKNCDEKTIIMMYGDHQPGLDSEVRTALGYNAWGNLEQKQQMYVVPFIIWTNYDIEEQSDMITSANYLKAHLLETAGIPLSNYEEFLLDCHAQYPAMNSLGYMDTSGTWHGVDINNGVEGILNTYHKLQYANIFDKSIPKELFLE